MFMEKQKRWQFFLIVAVVVLTLYNILPTIFYYAKPLKEPVDQVRAQEVAASIAERTNSLEDYSKEWLASFSKLLGVKARSIELNSQDNRYYQLTFDTTREADLFKRFLPRAGEMVAFAPAQLSLHTGVGIEDPKTVTVERRVGVHLKEEDLEKIFQYAPKFEANGQVSPLYQQLVYDRVLLLAQGLAGPSKNASQMVAAIDNASDPRSNELLLSLAKDIVSFDRMLGGNAAAAKRYFATFTQVDTPDAGALVQKFTTRVSELQASLEKQKQGIVDQEKKLKENNQLLDSAQVQSLSVLDYQTQLLSSAAAILKKNAAAFKGGLKPLTEPQLLALLSKSAEGNKTARFQEISLNGYHPFIQSLEIAWDADEVRLKLYPDIQAIRAGKTQTEAAMFAKDQLDQMIVNDIARLSNQTDEVISPSSDDFVVNLNQLAGTNSILALDLGYLANQQANQLQEEILSSWAPTHTDLVRENYPVRDYNTYTKESNEARKLGLVIYAPANYQEAPPEGFRKGSIYVIAKGLGSVLQKLHDAPQSSEENQKLIADFNALNKLLQQDGFIGYPGSSYGAPPGHRNDYIFELDDYYSNLLKATREDFYVRGSKRFAVLDFTDVEQRILASNKIEDRIQEDLLKWRDEYQAAQVDLDATNRYTIPAPTQNPYWENFKLSFLKYFRGDERKVLKWGLDLSGGKTVRIGLRDQNNHPVTDPEDLKQAVNELYTRINNMGVSERTIRIENENILLDFPGSQNLSAHDLVKASAMYFHVANEKFSPGNATLASSVNQFLQGVWNEAVVTNRKDAESINEIAWQHLGALQDGQPTRPMSDEAKVLYDNGLRLANPKERSVSSAFNDTLSSIGVFRGDDYAAWYNQTHPLLVVFHNYALEGSSLTGIQVGYDASQGNMLMFGVKRSYEGGRSGSPREDFYTWTSQFSEEKIAGTPKEAYSHGKGWRMAVILNGTIISAPTLGAALSDQATITGRFSQREVNQLAADLKAGSLSFTPRILSEQNVSPELGKEERFKGIMASIIALVLVVLAMVGYYRFAGVVASCAVLFNLLIMWGVLQNLDAALTLPGIAGIVLTIGMAVDANVLVFERVREEFKASGRIASAIQAGYRKAFTAIIDSNITTLIAAIILIQFDSGPIKGFAVTLIIGIASSMFTALFMTRYFFAGWVQNPKNKSLTMSQWIHDTKFDFLAQKKKAIILSLLMIVIGGFLLFSQRATIFGMDFTGGYSLTVELQEQPETNYRLAATEALMKQGATHNDIQVRELSRPNQLRIQIGEGMEEHGHPFYQMPQQLSEGQFLYTYQKDPRLNWVVNALSQGGLTIAESQLNHLESNWTIMSGQLSDTMRNNAIIALAIALFSILVYITFRFEFKYAIGAVVGLVHDVALTLGILALFHKLGFAVQIDLQVIGAIMTIIGYSLNDTIIVFDRIREDVRSMRKMPFAQVINHALNVTLSRTLMTSGTTLLVLLALVLLGGQSIFAFSLVMTIGVVVGTLSSLFIAAPVMLYFHNREHREPRDERKDGIELKRIKAEG
jgi:SecD/SecF fusion protein